LRIGPQVLRGSLCNATGEVPLEISTGEIFASLVLIEYSVVNPQNRSAVVDSARITAGGCIRGMSATAVVCSRHLCTWRPPGDIGSFVYLASPGGHWVISLIGLVFLLSGIASDVNKTKFLRPRPEQQDQDQDQSLQDQDQSDKTKTGLSYHGCSYNTRTAHH